MPLLPSKSRLKQWSIAALSTLPLWLSLAPLTALAQSPARPDNSSSEQRFEEMFSLETQKILSACAAQGRVSLAARADRDQSVICMDGSRTSPIAFNTYVDTLSNVLAAGGLVGLLSSLGPDPNPEVIQVISQMFSKPEGKAQLQSMLKKQLADTEVVSPQEPPASLDFLVGHVVDRLMPALKDPSSSVLPTRDASTYQSVVKDFCQPPGKSLNQVLAQVPNLNTIQIFAICLQEAGLEQELQRRANQRQDGK